MKITGQSAAEIFERVRQLTRSGVLAPGAVLPSVRDLALQLGLNRNTVATAYKRLVAAGIATSHGRSGTVVSQPSSPKAHEGLGLDSVLVNLSSGNPDAALLPDVSAILAASPYTQQLYGVQAVDPELSALGDAWLAQDCPGPYDINLSNGAVDAIERLMTAHLVPGDKVALEDPCFLGSINAVQVAGMQVVGIAMDSEGMLPDALDAALASGVQAVVLTPRAHNPTGCSMTAGRARALRGVLASYPHVLVMVDDHYGLLARETYHDMIPPGTLRWALIRSVSKVLGPDLRLAIVASDKQSSLRLRQRLTAGATWVSRLLQHITKACLSSPAGKQHIHTAQQQYQQRRGQCVDALAQQGIHVPADGDGLNVWIPLPHDVYNAQKVALALADRGWRVHTGDTFAIHADINALRVTVSTMTTARAEQFAADLALVLQTCAA